MILLDLIIGITVIVAPVVSILAAIIPSSAAVWSREPRIRTFGQIAEGHAINFLQIIQPNLPTIPELHEFHTRFGEDVDDLVIGPN